MDQNFDKHGDQQGWSIWSTITGTVFHHAGNVLKCSFRCIIPSPTKALGYCVWSMLESSLVSSYFTSSWCGSIRGFHRTTLHRTIWPYIKPHLTTQHRRILKHIIRTASHNHIYRDTGQVLRTLKNNKWLAAVQVQCGVGAAQCDFTRFQPHPTAQCELKNKIRTPQHQGFSKSKIRTSPPRRKIVYSCR